MYRPQTTADFDYRRPTLVLFGVTVAIAAISTLSSANWATIAPGLSQFSVLPSREPPSLSKSAPISTPSADEPVLRQKLDMLQRGMAFLKAENCYTAKLTKQELVGGELLPEHVISMKCRQEPFSVYLYWHTGDPGREVIYVEGANRGRLIGHDGGWKARIPAISVKPDSALAMRDSRYPVTKAGLGGLAEIMIEFHEHDLQNHTFKTCSLRPHVSFEGRDCDEFTTVYQNKDVSPQYRKSITLIDREWNLPLASRHYEWPHAKTPQSDEQLDAETLIESYEFTEVDFDVDFNDSDFDRDNEEYAFR